MLVSTPCTAIPQHGNYLIGFESTLNLGYTQYAGYIYIQQVYTYPHLHVHLHPQRTRESPRLSLRPGPTSKSAQAPDPDIENFEC